jgi:hypothetical protein
MLKDYTHDKETADHTWGGDPIGQAAFAIFTRQQVRGAIERGEKVSLYGRTFVGVDVARYGDDKTVMYKRKGNVMIERREYKKLSVTEVCSMALEFGNFDPEVQYNIDDTGVGGGVSDILYDKGWRVLPVNFAQKAGNPERYANIVSEMIFNLREKIPFLTFLDVPDLTEELTGRTWYMTKDNRRAVESKDDFKKRLGRSCDDMDACILAFYEPIESGGAAALGDVI